jgi:ABC-2 type transport system ATP-binding protein
MTAHAVTVTGLHKDFGEVYAVRDVDFAIEQGEIFSLLGPNGAGKTTTILMIAGLLSPTAGDVSVEGHSVREEPMAVKASLGVVPQEVAIYDDLTARENLLFWGKMYGMRGSDLRRRVDDVLDLIQLTDRQNQRTGKYSGGMRRRLNIGIALLHRPRVMVLDEPTVGIDPQSRRNILDGIKDLNREGMTVLYTTHYMEEAQELSDHIAIMDHGQIIARGTHAELVEMVGEHDRLTLRLSEAREPLLAAWRGVEGVTGLTVDDSVVTALVGDSNLVLPRLFELANGAGVRIVSVDIEEPNLEAVFLHLTGRALRD